MSTGTVLYCTVLHMWVLPSSKCLWGITLLLLVNSFAIRNKQSIMVTTVLLPFCYSGAAGSEPQGSEPQGRVCYC